jgi:23S rRNA pseudouridine1911/1915/1917 synthase
MEKEKTLYHMVSEYVKVKNKNARIFVIHRLDKETSGIVMFAKSEKIKELYQNSWDDLVSYRGYMALVEGSMENKSGSIVQYLKESDDGYKVYSTNKELGKRAITFYKVVSKNDKYSLLDVEIKTGRKNQIRVAMKSLDHPVVGDHKYGSTDKVLRRLGLHAHKLIVTNPITNKEMKFETPVPREFYKYSAK